MRLRLAWALAAACLPAQAQDAAQGKLLYDTYCGKCHYERVHERLRPTVKDLAELRDAVARWVPQTGRKFTLDEREDVVQYLNESHYRFGLAPATPRRVR